MVLTALLFINPWPSRSSALASYVFSVNDCPIDTNHLYRVFQRLQNEAGISNAIRVLDTRHTFASQYMMKGLGDIYSLGQILGHADALTSQR
jgi:site-specific recombinase XerD